MVGACCAALKHYIAYSYDERDSFTTHILGIYNEFNDAYNKILPELTNWRELVYYIEIWENDKCLGTHRY